MVNLLVNASLWLALVGVGVVLVERLTEPARSLGLTLFRPWRGEHWPIGVQEDDDARFNWHAAAAAKGAAPSATPTARPRPASASRAPRPKPTDGMVIEELDGDDVSPVHLSRVEVRAHRG